MNEKISIDDFAKIELRVGMVKVAERVPKADKLLRLEIDIGTETRQVLAGIAEAYAPETFDRAESCDRGESGAAQVARDGIEWNDRRGFARGRETCAGGLSGGRARRGEIEVGKTGLQTSDVGLRPQLFAPDPEACSRKSESEV